MYTYSQLERTYGNVFEGNIVEMLFVCLYHLGHLYVTHVIPSLAGLV